MALCPDVLISLRTHRTWTFECEGEGRRLTLQKVLYREFGVYVLQFEYGPEPIFEPKLAFSPHFVELSLQWLLVNVKIGACIAAGPYPREQHPRCVGPLHLPRTLLSALFALTAMSQECNILPIYQSPEGKVWPMMGSVKQGRLYNSVDFYSQGIDGELSLVINSKKWS